MTVAGGKSADLDMAVCIELRHAPVARHRGGRMLVLAAMLWVPMLYGCAGSATIHMVPLGSKKISQSKPLVVRVVPDECYYWVDSERKLCVAMRDAKTSPFGKRFERDFILSLVLDGLPAGSARTYRLDPRSLRAKARVGYSRTRAASLSGIAAVWDYGRGNLHGRFRLTGKQQSYSVLTGWYGDRRVVVVGEFSAVADQGVGERILAETEKGGMSRGLSCPIPIPVQGPPPVPQQTTSPAPRTDPAGQ